MAELRAALREKGEPSELEEEASLRQAVGLTRVSWRSRLFFLGDAWMMGAHGEQGLLCSAW